MGLSNGGWIWWNCTAARGFRAAWADGGVRPSIGWCWVGVVGDLGDHVGGVVEAGTADVADGGVEGTEDEFAALEVVNALIREAWMASSFSRRATWWRRESGPLTVRIMRLWK